MERQPLDSIHVARSGDAVYIRVHGIGSHHNSMTFADFATAMIVHGYRKFVLDLAPCEGLDSTFMGIIAEIALSGDEVSMMVVNGPQRCRRVLEEIGVDTVVDMNPNPYTPPEIETEELQLYEYDQSKRIEFIRRAHQRLIDIDERNHARFGAFLKMLTAEMKKEKLNPGDEENPSED